MSLYEDRIDRRVCEVYDQVEQIDSFIESRTRSLAADDDVLADGLNDALYDPRTRSAIISAVRSGDLLEGMRIAAQHATTTYINEQAEVEAEKAFHL